MTVTSNQRSPFKMAEFSKNSGVPSKWRSHLKLVESLQNGGVASNQRSPFKMAKSPQIADSLQNGGVASKQRNPFKIAESPQMRGVASKFRHITISCLIDVNKTKNKVIKQVFLCWINDSLFVDNLSKIFFLYYPYFANERKKHFTLANL